MASILFSNLGELYEYDTILAILRSIIMPLDGSICPDLIANISTEISKDIREKNKEYSNENLQIDDDKFIEIGCKFIINIIQAKPPKDNRVHNKLDDTDTDTNTDTTSLTCENNKAKVKKCKTVGPWHGFTPGIRPKLLEIMASILSKKHDGVYKYETILSILPFIITTPFKTIYYKLPRYVATKISDTYKKDGNELSPLVTIQLHLIGEDFINAIIIPTDLYEYRYATIIQGKSSDSDSESKKRKQTVGQTEESIAKKQLSTQLETYRYRDYFSVKGIKPKKDPKDRKPYTRRQIPAKQELPTHIDQTKKMYDDEDSDLEGLSDLEKTSDEYSVYL
jgi:hypothetical protein